MQQQSAAAAALRSGTLIPGMLEEPYRHTMGVFSCLHGAVDRAHEVGDAAVPPTMLYFLVRRIHSLYCLVSL